MMITFTLTTIFLFFLFIFSKLNFDTQIYSSKSELKLSVIIAAKNESANISELINSLNRQNYSKNNYEVVIVDDNSTDSTFESTRALIADLSNFQIIRATKKKYKGKRGALQIGIEAAGNNYIVITDADCILNKNFLSAYSSKFKEKYEFIFGAAPFYQTDTFTNKIVCFDNLWVHVLSFSFANQKLPYSASARSFGFNKTSFEQVKGFRNTLETLSGDDDLLLREAVKNKLKVGTIIDPEAFAYSKAKTTLVEYIKQKSRHTTTSHHYLLSVKLILGLWHILNIAMLFSIFFVFINPIISALFFIKMIGDVLIVRKTMYYFGYTFTILGINYLQILYEYFLIINYFGSFFRKNKW